MERSSGGFSPEHADEVAEVDRLLGLMAAISCCIVFALALLAPTGATALGPPHNEEKGIDCIDCHDAHGPNPLKRRGADQATMCMTCHNVTGMASEMVDVAVHTVDGGTIIDCGSCHDPHGPTAPDPLFPDDFNLSLIRAEITKYVPTAQAPATFLTRPDDFISESYSYNAVCQACHTTTDHFRNDGSGPDQDHTTVTLTADHDCIECHSHENGFGHGGSGGGEGGASGCGSVNSCHGTQKSHPTHLLTSAEGGLLGVDCDECHDMENLPAFADGNDLAMTSVCDNCHSPGGTYDGVSMAKANFETGVYEEGRDYLHTGKELWCATCHDDAPAWSRGEKIDPLIVDNLDPETTRVGSWTSATDADEHFEFDFEYSDGGSGASTFSWQPSLPRAGDYKLYAWWGSDEFSFATDAPFSIDYDGGSETVLKNQAGRVGRWNLLGSFPFAAGNSGTVTLSDAIASAQDRVAADAIMWTDPGTAAPNVVGDGSTYGYYLTGHKIDCLECHDANKPHIDHEHRSYEADEASNTAITSYTESYRLRDVNGQPALVVPRNTSNRNPISDWADYALCFDCHDPYQLVGTSQADDSVTNLRSDITPNRNAHWYHLSMMAYGSDTDWDWAMVGSDDSADSLPTCIVCHNVHGPPNSAMVRHGELMSTPGTQEAVPGMNFAYILPGDGSGKARYTPSLPLAGDYVVSWKSSGDPYQYRTAATNAQFEVKHDAGAASTIVIVDQSATGNVELSITLGTFYFDATGDEYVELSSEGANGRLVSDAVHFQRVGTGEEVIVDENAASYEPDISAWPYGYFGANDSRFYAAKLDPMARAEDSVGGFLDMLPALDNPASRVCYMCHPPLFSWVRAPKAE